MLLPTLEFLEILPGLDADLFEALISLAEDEAGNAVTFSLYQQEAENIRSAVETLKKDSVILLKEPYFKSVGDGGYGLRVDHPTDIVWLSSDDPNVPQAWRACKDDKTADEWKQQGNTMVKTGDFRESIKRYVSKLTELNLYF